MIGINEGARQLELLDGGGAKCAQEVFLLPEIDRPTLAATPFQLRLEAILEHLLVNSGGGPIQDMIDDLVDGFGCFGLHAK